MNSEWFERKELVERAIAAAEQCGKKARRPIVIEFSGVPKAGKTSNLEAVQKFFQSTGFRVETVVERASLCPIRDKKHPDFNIWTACTTLACLLKKTQPLKSGETPRDDDPQILFLDRGVFDAVCWMHLMDTVFERLHADERKSIEKFLLQKDWRRRISAVILMTTSPERAMEREHGEHGSIMNPDVLNEIKKTVDKIAKKYGKQFNIHTLNTALSRYGTLPKSADYIAETVLGCVERQIEENILHMESEKIKEFFGRERYINAATAKNLINDFAQSRAYAPREKVECDMQKIQALPVVVVRDKVGRFLRLTRREAAPKDPLHQEHVIWAGGHVRQEDDKNGNPILQCAIRELREELRLSVGEKDLTLVGAVYVDDAKGAVKTAQHVALVYEWRASGAVNIVLSGVEFFEQLGNSTQGDFYALDANEIRNIKEPWSAEIIKFYAGQRRDSLV